MVEQFDTFASTINRGGSGGGGNTTIVENSGGGTTLASSSDISIDGVTAKTGTFSTLTVTGNSNLNTVTAATTTFNGNVTINRTLTVKVISSRRGVLGSTTEPSSSLPPQRRR